MTNNEALKPCPFHENSEENYENIANEFLRIIDVSFPIKILDQPPNRKQIRCGYCGATGPVEVNQEAAIAAWNKRAKK
jgi:hypothetical protein